MAETKLETMFLMTILHMRLLKVWTLVTLTATGMCHIPVDVLYLFQTLCTCSPHSSMLLSSLVWLVGWLVTAYAIFHGVTWASCCHYTVQYTQLAD